MPFIQSVENVAKVEKAFLAVCEELSKVVEECRTIPDFRIHRLVEVLLTVVGRACAWIEKEPLKSNPKRLDYLGIEVTRAKDRLVGARINFLRNRDETRERVVHEMKVMKHFASLLNAHLAEAEQVILFDIPELAPFAVQVCYDIELKLERGQKVTVNEVVEASQNASTQLNVLRDAERSFYEDEAVLNDLRMRINALRRDETVFRRVGNGLFHRAGFFAKLAKPGSGESLALLRKTFIVLLNQLVEVEEEVAAKEASARVAEVLTPPPSKRRKPRRYVAKGEKRSEPKEKKGGKKEKKGEKGRRKLAVAA